MQQFIDLTVHHYSQVITLTLTLALGEDLLGDHCVQVSPKSDKYCRRKNDSCELWKDGCLTSMVLWPDELKLLLTHLHSQSYHLKINCDQLGPLTVYKLNMLIKHLQCQGLKGHAQVQNTAVPLWTTRGSKHEQISIHSSVKIPCVHQKYLQPATKNAFGLCVSLVSLFMEAVQILYSFHKPLFASLFVFNSLFVWILLRLKVRSKATVSYCLAFKKYGGHRRMEVNDSVQ